MRQRTWFSYDKCARVWAARSQEEGNAGRRSGGHNPRMYFREFDTIFSYGTHFPMAQFRENSRGERCIIVTTRSYGPTTGKHLTCVRAAAANACQRNNWPLLYVADVPTSTSYALDHPKTLRSYHSEYMDHMLTSGRARKEWSRNYQAGAAQRQVDMHNAYLQFFFGDTDMPHPILTAPMSGKGLLQPMVYPDDIDAEFKRIKLARKVAEHEYMIMHGVRPQGSVIDNVLLDEGIV